MPTTATRRSASMEVFLLALLPIRLFSSASLVRTKVGRNHVQGLLGPLVPYVIEALAHEVLYVGAIADLGVCDAHVLRIQLFGCGSNARIGEYQLLRHAVEHLVDGLLDFGVPLNSGMLDHDAHIGKTACDLRRPDGRVGHVEPLKNIDHVVPAIKRHQRIALGQGGCLLGRFLAIAVIRFGPVGDGLCLTERFDEERIVGPACTGDFLKPDIVLQQKIATIDCRPNGRVMGQQVRGVVNGERLPRRFNATAIRAVQLDLLRGIGVADDPIGGLDNVELVRIAKLPLCKIEHIREHSGLNPVIGLEDGDPVALCLANAQVAGSAVTLVGLIDHANARIAHSEILHYGERVVGRSVVNGEDFQLNFVLA